jgi:hypothetical protein
MYYMKTYHTIGPEGVWMFDVVITKSKISVYKKNDSKVLYEIKKYNKVWIGKNSPRYKLNLKSYRNSIKPFIGASILIEIKDKEYIFISNEIQKFKTLEPIIEFHSQMATLKNFPKIHHLFPFALTENYAYVLVNNVYLERDFGDIHPFLVYYDQNKTWKRKINDLKIDYIDLKKQNNKLLKYFFGIHA